MEFIASNNLKDSPPPTYRREGSNPDTRSLQKQKMYSAIFKVKLKEGFIYNFYYEEICYSFLMLKS